MLAEAFAIYRKRFGALVLTCALALIPANLLMAGTVLVGVAGIGTASTAEVQEKTQDLQQRPADERKTQLRQLAHEAMDSGGAFTARNGLQLAYAVLIVVAILLVGIALAHAAIVPLVLGTASGPAGAWAAVATRLRELGSTVVLAVPIVAIASLFCVVPGVIAAVGFGLAIPAAMSERLPGKAALERSWNLMRGHWGEALAIWALIAAFTIVASLASRSVPPGPWRAVVSGVVRLVTYPFPLVALVLLYVNTSGESRLPDSSARGSPGT